MISQVGLAGVMPDAATVDRENPWPGLESYREADEEFFHGRLEESDELLRSVLRAQLTVFFGKSGLGKTSLLQAGLFPRLRKQTAFPIYIRLAFPADQASLSAQVKEAISKAAAAMKVEAPPAKEKETLWEYFHHQEADFWSERNQLMLPVLVFDQFEEIFTQGRADENQEKASDALLVELGDLIEGRPPARVKEYLDANPTEAGRFSFSRHNYRIVLSLREDFLPELEGLKERIPSLHHNRLRLLPMNGKAARDVVAHAKELIATNVAEQVVRFVAAEDNPDKPLQDLVIEPALLSVVCRELNNKRKEKGEPRINPGLLEGTQKEILDDFYQRSVADLKPEVRTFIEDHLLTKSGHRNSFALDNALSSPGISPEVINSLVNRRLIRKEERLGSAYLELTHDVLTTVITARRDLRHQVENEEKLKKEIADKEKQQRLEERARSARRLRWLSVGLAICSLIAIVTSIIAIRLWNKEAYLRAGAEREEKKVEEQMKAQKVIMKVRLSISQAIISNNMEEVRKSIENLPLNHTIDFKVTKEYLYRGPRRSIYKFKIFPDPASIPDGLKSIALITYVMDHPTFSNQLQVTSVVTDKQFIYSYEGWGYLDEVIAIIEYTDIEKPPVVVKFNMGEKLGEIPLPEEPGRSMPMKMPMNMPTKMPVKRIPLR